MRGRLQRGAAILIAMLTVSLVATFAAAALWQQWRTVEVEGAERARVQSGWILTGALDWARLLLREDLRGSGGSVDHLGEPWAVPLQEARLSSFLAADRNVATDYGPDVLDAFLSGRMADLQARINLNQMIDNTGKPLPDQLESLANLFEVLNLPASDYDRLAENLRFAIASTRTPQAQAQAPLPPQKVEQLVWLGLTPETVAALEPFVTLLPPGYQAKVNINTAPAEVIAAAAGIDMAQAQAIVQQRERSHFRSEPDAVRRITEAGGAPQGQGIGFDVKSNFFEIRARLRLDRWVVEERSVIQRRGVDEVVVVQRERGVVDPTPVTAAQR